MNSTYSRYIKFYIFSLLFIMTGISEAQWEPDVRLTNDNAISRTSFSWAWCISAVGDIVHVVWFEEGGWEIYYKRSIDGGTSWDSTVRLTNSPGWSVTPSVSASGSFVHVVWEDKRDGNYRIYYKKSIDDGITWSIDTPITNNNINSYSPSLSVFGSSVHIVWTASVDVFYKHSLNQGDSWSNEVRLTNEPAVSYSPCLSASGLLVHVTWSEYRDGNSEIYYKFSSDTGNTWSSDTRLTNDTSRSYEPTVCSFGYDVHIFWREYRDGNAEIYYKRSTDGGLSWGADTRLTNEPSHSGQPNSAASGSVVHLVWVDLRDGNPEIYYKRSTDRGVNWESDTRLTDYYSDSPSPSVAVSGTSVHVVWHDNRDGNYEIYYKRNPTGNPIGLEPIGDKIPEVFKLYQNYPNPFNPSTKIRFSTPLNPPFIKGGTVHSTGGFITLKIYDILGREVTTLVNDNLKPGTYEVEWNASNYPSGIYFYQLSTDRFMESKKMLLVR